MKWCLSHLSHEAIVKSVLFAEKWLPLRHVPSETDYNGDQTAGQREDEHKDVLREATPGVGFLLRT